MTLRLSNELDFYVLPDEPIVLESELDPSASPVSWSIRPAVGYPVDITKEISREQWDDVAMGGFGSCTFDIPKQLWENDSRIRPWSDVVISDGEVSLYEGRIQNIRRSSDASGSFMHVVAGGWQGHADDDMYRGARVDRNLNRWKPESRPDDAGEVIQDIRLRRTRPEAYGPALLVTNSFDDEPDDGQTYVARGGDRFQVRYELPATWPGGIKKLQFTWAASLNSTKRALRVRSFDPNTDTYVTHYEQEWTKTAQFVEITDFADDVRKVWIQVVYMLDDVTYLNKAWLRVWGPDDRGPVVWSAIDDGRAHKIVREVASRACPQFDLTNIRPTTFVVEDIDFIRPVYPREVFDQMVLYGPDAVGDSEFIWGVREKLPNGLRKFYFEPLPSDVAYEVSGVQISDLGGERGTLRNKAILQYIDAEGFESEVVATQTVDELDEAGLTRTVSYDGVEVKTASRALRIAQMLLSQHKYAIRSGTITVAGSKVLSTATHAPIPTWRLRPGRWIRLLDMRVTGRTPHETRQPNVFLITKIAFTEGGARATLTLDSTPNKADKILARLRQRLG